MASYGVDSFYTVYDKRGNMELPGAEYDDKINPYRTNKVWQLIFQNYSMNNQIYPGLYPPFIVNYDRWGLPLAYQLTSSNPQPEIFLYYDLLGLLSVSYSCDEEGSKLPASSPPL